MTYMPVHVVNVKTMPAASTETDSGLPLIYVANSMPGWEASPLGKPYAFAKHDDPIASYKTWLVEQLKDKRSPQAVELRRLAQKAADREEFAIGCWCKPKRCHADFLKSLIDELAYRIQRKRHLHFLVGDATAPDTDTTGPGIIIHICNDQGGWGAGFVVALSRKWSAPERAYRKMNSYTLGDVGFVEVESQGTLYVANMIAQHGYRSANGQIPLRYDALETCLLKVAEALEDGDLGPWEYKVHMPRIGCGLAGGRWEKVEEVIGRTLITRGIDCYVYDLA